MTTLSLNKMYSAICHESLNKTQQIYNEKYNFNMADLKEDREAYELSKLD